LGPAESTGPGRHPRFPVPFHQGVSPMDHLKNNELAPGTEDAGRLTDALELWQAEGPGAARPPLEGVRLDANERLLVPFTTSTRRVQLHYLDAPALRGYLRCQGPGCLLCRLGKEPETRDLLPVYDPVAQAVGVLAISPNLRPQALRPPAGPGPAAGP